MSAASLELLFVACRIPRCAVKLCSIPLLGDEEMVLTAPSLFTAPARPAVPDVPGLHYFPAFLDHDAQVRACAAIDDPAAPWRDDLMRRVQHYGWRYDYKGRTITRDMWIGPLPDWLHDMASKSRSERVCSIRFPAKPSSTSTCPGRESPCMWTGSVSARPWPPFRWGTIGSWIFAHWNVMMAGRSRFCLSVGPLS